MKFSFPVVLFTLTITCLPSCSLPGECYGNSRKNHICDTNYAENGTSTKPDSTTLPTYEYSSDPAEGVPESLGSGITEGVTGDETGSSENTSDLDESSSTAPEPEEPECGNGVLDVGEECDNGNADGDGGLCPSNCQYATCGDGFVYEDDEECDDGNLNDLDGCRNDCDLAFCGDGVVYEGEEECDDGNSVVADGCENDCTKTKALGVIAGGYHSCALLSGGVVRCWGSGQYGALGSGNTDWIGDNELPSSKEVVSVGSIAKSLSAGFYHNCAVSPPPGELRCWGLNAFGQLGQASTNSIGDDELPNSVGKVSLGATLVAQVASGNQHTCTLLTSGEVRCWGWNAYGQLGKGNTTWIGDDELPTSIGAISLGGSATQISSGGAHSCAILEGGQLRCWGLNSKGQLGYGNTDKVGDNELPSSKPAVDTGGVVVQVTAGATHTCVLLEGDFVRCWGSNEFGELGYGHTEVIGDDELPSSLPKIVGLVTQISAGEDFTCALYSNLGHVKCWGRNDHGQLGYGHTNNIGDNELPSSGLYIVDVGAPVTQISSGFRHTCALLDTGTVRCWGSGEHGRLGYGNTLANNGLCGGDNFDCTLHSNCCIGDDEKPVDVGDVQLW